MSVFGFSTSSSEGSSDIIPVVKYHAPGGRMFRVDRVNTGAGWERHEDDITSTFKALCDFENIETGWLHFPQAGAPQFNLVPLGQQIPARPSPDHKNGVRFMMKLAKECGGEQPIREISSSARAFLSGLETVYIAYKEQAAQNAGKLPVVALEKVVAVKNSAGTTNYQPVFKIIGWAPRGDLVFRPKAGGASAQAAAPAPTVQAPPSTGSTRVSAPAMADDMADFG